MATGSITLDVTAAILDSTNPPAYDVPNRVMKLRFDDSTDEIAYFKIPAMPADYASAPTLRVLYSMTSATSGDVVWACEVMAVSSGDSQDTDADSFDTANTATDTVAATAGHMKTVAVTLTNNDSLAARDFVTLKVYRDANNGSDTAAGDAELIGLLLEYTTT